jgi:hypothetical protein
MYEQLSKLLENNDFNGLVGSIVNRLFLDLIVNSQEELNVKSAILKQAFLNEFDFQFEKRFLDESNNVNLQSES